MEGLDMDDMGVAHHWVPGGRRLSQAQREILTGVANELAGHFALEGLLERILHHGLALTGRSAGVLRVDRVEGEAHPVDPPEAVANVSAEDVHAVEAMLVETRSLRGPQAYGRYRPGTSSAHRAVQELPSPISFPVIWDGSVIGVCVLYGPQPGEVPDEQELEGVFVLAKHAAIAVTYAQTHARASERGVELAVLAERERAADLLRTTVERELLSVRRALDPTRLSPADPRSLHSAAWNARRTVDSALARIGTLAAPEAAFDRAFLDSISLELTWAESRGVAATDLSVIGTAYPLAPGPERRLLQVLREAIVNVVLHARAHRLRAGVIYGEAQLVVIIDDDGVGYTGRLEPASGLSVALKGARDLGITSDIESTPGWGTRIRITVPRAVVAPGPMMSSPVSVLVVAEHTILRAGLVRLLTADDLSIAVVGEAACADSALMMYELMRPDAVVAAVAEGTAVLAKLSHRLRDHDPEVRLVLVADGAAEPASDENRAVATRVGASAVAAIPGEESSELAGRVVAAVRGEAAAVADAEDSSFTPREREVHDLIRCGLPDKQIATALNISAKTVEKHVGKLLRKSGARNRTMLAQLSQS
jgi:DNA-binding NarL/FixJ family response regulator/signal transduction histidine kinase